MSMKLSFGYLLAFLLLFGPVRPAAASFQGEWESAAAWSDMAAGDDWFCSTGLRLGGDWQLNAGSTLTWRGTIGFDTRTDGIQTEVERLYAQYEQEAFRLRLGRQAVSWGVGRFFRPTDLVTPRTPLSAEEVRPGQDLLTATWATSALTKLELLAGGENLAGGRIGWRLNRTDLNLSGLIEPGGTKTVGLDFQGGLGGFYSEAAYQWLDDAADGSFAAMAGWKKTLKEGTIIYLEYLYDGRGRFYAGRNYLAAGIEIPRDELTTYTLALLGNLDDGGSTLAGRVSLILGDALDLEGGAAFVLGPAGTEFYTLAGGARTSLSVRLKYYF